MIAKGTVHDNGARLARYLITSKRGETAQLSQLRGFASDDILLAFRSIHVMAEATRCEHPFFHIQVKKHRHRSAHSRSMAHRCRSD
jgi:hypothetical protein